MYDVVVVGSGFAGLGAALAAGRNGAKTLVMERYGFLGGTTTAALVACPDGIRLTEHRGITKELYDLLIRKGVLAQFPLKDRVLPYAFFEDQGGLDVAEFQFVVLDLLEEAGVELLLHSYATGVVKKGGTLTALVAHNKSGRQEIEAKIFIDATGDADIANQAGAPFIKGGNEQELQSPSLIFEIGGVDEDQWLDYFRRNPDDFGVHPREGRLKRDPDFSGGWTGCQKLIEKARRAGDLKMQTSEIGIGVVRMNRRGFYHVNATRINHIDGTDARSLTRAQIEGLKQVREIFAFMKKYIPGFDKAYIQAIAPQVGIRETRRIVADYMYSIDDVREGRQFADTIAKWVWGHTDIHSAKDNKWHVELVEGPFCIPYRSLLPQQVDNLLVAGRCIGTDRLVNGTIRTQPACMSVGQAAGTAAAFAAKEGGSGRASEAASVRAVDVPALRAALADQGAWV